MAAIRKIIIPSLWPTIIAGMTLVVFETIADFGGVSTLRVETFTVGIYDAWFGYQSYFSATRLAGYLLIFVFIIVFLSKYFGEKSSILASKTGEKFQKLDSSIFIKIAIFFLCLTVFIIVFCLPATIQLIIWYLSESNLNLYTNFKLLINSTAVGLSASLATIFFGIALALSYKQLNILKSLILISSSGYAIPGSVISAGLLVGFDFLFNTSITFYGIFGLIVCLALRFMTPAFNYISASLSNISKSAENALATKPNNALKAFYYFYLPQMRPAIFLSLCLYLLNQSRNSQQHYYYVPLVLIHFQLKFITLLARVNGKWQQGLVYF